MDTDQQVREVFNQVIHTVEDPANRAHLEVMREYFTNPQFRKALEDLVWAITNG